VRTQAGKRVPTRTTGLPYCVDESLGSEACLFGVELSDLAVVPTVRFRAASRPALSVSLLWTSASSGSVPRPEGDPETRRRSRPGPDPRHHPASSNRLPFPCPWTGSPSAGDLRSFVRSGDQVVDKFTVI